MAQTNGVRQNGPRAPKTDRLEELMDWVTREKDPEHFGPSAEGLKQGLERDNTLQEIVEALDWTHTMLSNRSGYQKKQQVKRKALETWARENLSPDELAALDKQAQEKANE